MSFSSDYMTTADPACTLARFDVITTWSAARPLGLRARIITKNPDFLEAAEIYRRHPSVGDHQDVWGARNGEEQLAKSWPGDASLEVNQISC